MDTDVHLKIKKRVNVKKNPTEVCGLVPIELTITKTIS